MFREKVVDIQKVEEQHFIISTDKDNEYHSKSIIIAVGGGIIKPLTLDIEGAERFELSNLNYVVQSIQNIKINIYYLRCWELSSRLGL